jgi:hypothetical protein
MVGGYQDGWELTPKPDYQAEYIELQRRAIAVTRIWDMLARCSDEFEPDDMAACGEYRDNLDEAIIGLMKMVDRPMWDRREHEMKAAAERRSAVVEEER